LFVLQLLWLPRCCRQHAEMVKKSFAVQLRASSDNALRREGCRPGQVEMSRRSRLTVIRWRGRGIGGKSPGSTEVGRAFASEPSKADAPQVRTNFDNAVTLMHCVNQSWRSGFSGASRRQISRAKHLASDQVGVLFFTSASGATTCNPLPPVAHASESQNGTDLRRRSKFCHLDQPFWEVPLRSDCSKAFRLPP
jgi:hypothetical protein